MAKSKSTPKCTCGCGQAPATNCRLRKITAQCGCLCRVSREMIGRGGFVCPCGNILEPCCWEDRQWMPGSEGQAACDTIETRMLEFDRRSANSRKAMRMRRRCKLDSCGAL